MSYSPHISLESCYQKKTKDIKCWQGHRVIETLSQFVEMQNGAAVIENRMEIPQNLKIGLSCDPAISLLSIYIK